jgi:Radical SAM superfamily/Iron-sulfur cluster-binding domain
LLNALDGPAKIVAGELSVENTTFCGAKCIMCPRDEFQRERHWQHMSLEIFKDVVDQGVALGVTSVDICGFGDPLMDPSLKDKLDYVKSNYPQVNIYTTTTGHLLNQKNINLACEYFDTVKISNYGMSKDIYEKVHGGVVKFEKVWENLHNLLAIRREERPHVIMSFLVFSENEHEIERWKAYWGPRADEIMVWLPHNYGGSANIEPVAYKSSARRRANEPRSCGRPFRGSPFVRANGDISVCCFDFNHKLVIGNLREASLVDILGGEQLARVREVHKSQSFEGCGLICEDCDQIFDRKDALLFASNSGRGVDQKTTTLPDHFIKLLEEASAF